MNLLLLSPDGRGFPLVVSHFSFWKGRCFLMIIWYRVLCYKLKCLANRSRRGISSLIPPGTTNLLRSDGIDIGKVLRNLSVERNVVLIIIQDS